MKALELRQDTMKPLLRALLRPILSPRVFQSVRFRWWCLSSYFPGLVISLLAKRTPQVCGFGAAQIPSHLAKQIQSVNALAPTRMCRVMTKHGSDKGRLLKYTTVYSALFKERRNEPLRVLELGLGTNNPDVPSNMGIFGAPGASLRGWRDLFPHARVYGADIDRRILFQEDRIKTFYCDQLDRSSIRGLWSQPDLQGGADIIIEDGLHTFEANITFMEESLGHLRPGGIYVTEDIIWHEVEQWYDRLETVYSKQYPTYEFAFVTSLNGGTRDPNLLVVRRGVD
jgi:SAM-dependent methyltransferase